MMNYKKLSNIKNDYLEEVYWLALQDKNYLIQTSKLINFYIQNSSLKNIYITDYYGLQDLGLNDKQIREFVKYRSKLDFNMIQKLYNSLKDKQIKLIKYTDKLYPDNLRNIKNQPLILFHKGNLLNFDNCIAIAGTRDPSHYGRIMARKIAFNLAQNGFTIVSGLAHGIDEWAHCGALEAKKGKTIAILAWMDPVYPSEHGQLTQYIASRGSILSELYSRPNSKMARGQFVQRNRITSGISDYVIAIESDEVGGTVHQVKIALEQGKLVFALRPKSNKRALRGYKLFQDLGALPIKSARDVIKIIKESMAQSSIKMEKSKQKKLDIG